MSGVSFERVIWRQLEAIIGMSSVKKMAVTLQAMGLTWAVSLTCACLAQDEDPDNTPVSEDEVDAAPVQSSAQNQQQPRLEALDQIVQGAMRQYCVPGAALAVTYGGRLVYAKGFGVANLRTGEPATERTLFNLGSCTKSLSAFGVLRLVEAGKLALDQPMVDAIGRPQLLRGMSADPRVAQITIRQLLHHSGGWNDDSGFEIAGREVKRLAPQGVPYAEAVKVLLATPLDYTPGTQANYANGQWNLIKYIIECAAQQSYGDFMTNQLGTIGITDMVAESPVPKRGQSMRYVGNPPHPTRAGQRIVPLMPSFGNWMASAVDMVKFLTAIDGTRMQGISPQSFCEMMAPLPPPMQNRKNGSHYGLGLDAVRPMPNGIFFTKNGAKAGVHAQIQHLPNGVDFCLLMNGGAAPDGKRANPLSPALKQIEQVLLNTSKWPQGDLFANYQ